jgi:hypothetical protein|tara:strand:+ start:387 stop:500 length:114 start_codon:yes stop_codon:yes gene_type:complete
MISTVLTAVVHIAIALGVGVAAIDITTNVITTVSSAF